MRAITEGLLTDDAPPRLIGGRHRASGRLVFPCPPGADYEAVPLAREGRLWSYTVQRYRPKSPPYRGPEVFTPFAVGYIELPGECIVEARLAHVDFADIAIGMPLELTLVPLDPEAAEPVVIPAFQPAGRAA